MQKLRVYMVGGFVRDYLLGIQSKDKDYMVEGTFEEMKEFVLGNGYVILHEKPEFLTLRVKIPTKEVVDFACCRLEADYDGRRPGTVEITNLNGDLSRRDFTVNAMAWEVDPVTFKPVGEIIDPFGGKQDLKDMKLRFVGDPIKRLEEDGLRWLRAIRFCITKGFSLTSQTSIIIAEPPLGAKTLEKVSVERIREELIKCFKHDTLQTIKVLNRVPPYWMKDGLWLEPSLKEK